MKRSHLLLPMLAAIAAGMLGCSEANPGRFPESKTPGASRAGATPLIPNDPGKQKPMSPKMKALMKSAEQADPRGR